MKLASEPRPRSRCWEQAPGSSSAFVTLAVSPSFLGLSFPIGKRREFKEVISKVTYSLLALGKFSIFQFQPPVPRGKKTPVHLDGSHIWYLGVKASTPNSELPEC